MSKFFEKMNNTKETIVQRALELFNDKGVEYGGMRELAALLNIRVSNITYYFATKDDLIMELVSRLADLNNTTIQTYTSPSIYNFLTMYKGIFHNQYAYRCLSLSFVHLFKNNKKLAEQYKQTEKKRRDRLINIYKDLAGNGYLKDISDADIKKLTGHISIIARFWNSEAIISYYDKTTDENISHYLGLMADVFLLYATPKGKKEIAAFLSQA